MGGTRLLLRILLLASVLLLLLLLLLLPPLMLLLLLLGGKFSERGISIGLDSFLYTQGGMSQEKSGCSFSDRRFSDSRGGWFVVWTRGGGGRGTSLRWVRGRNRMSVLLSALVGHAMGKRYALVH